MTVNAKSLPFGALSKLRDTVNQQVLLADAVKRYCGVELRAGSCRCPFHDDSRRSAKVHQDNSLYCFAESRTYRPYDVLKLMGVTDEQMFQQFSHLMQLPRRQSKDVLSAEKFFELRARMRTLPFSIESYHAAVRELFPQNQ